MNKITKEEASKVNGQTRKVAYFKEYVLRQISSDGLIKHHEDISEHQTFKTENEALQFCADKGIWGVVVLPIVAKDWFPE